MRPLVIIESPYAGDRTRNVAYAERALLDSLRRGEAPFASHLLYTRVLDDLDPRERALGIDAGWEWHNVAHKIAFYTDLGWSPGMIAAYERLTKDASIYLIGLLGAAEPSIEIRALDRDPIPYENR